VVADQFCTPTSTADLAAALARLAVAGRFGLYHLTNSECCSWYEFALTVFDLAGIKVHVNPITSRQYGAAARRPSYSVLATTVPDLLRTPMRPWREALAAYLGRGAATRACVPSAA
jgi:dTDP-4-dehydrorhamnose reductase